MRSRNPRNQQLAPKPELSSAARRSSLWIAPILVAIVVLLVSLPTVRNAFVDLDDSPYVSQKPASDGLTREAVAFAFTAVRPMYWHPLAWLSHELDTELYGSLPEGHHFTSALVHSLTAALLCIVLMQWGAPVLAAALGSLLWLCIRCVWSRSLGSPNAKMCCAHSSSSPRSRSICATETGRRADRMPRGWVAAFWR